MLKKCFIWQDLACVAVFSVSFQASGSRARARGQRWQKTEKTATQAKQDSHSECDPPLNDIQLQ